MEYSTDWIPIRTLANLEDLEANQAHATSLSLYLTLASPLSIPSTITPPLPPTYLTYLTLPSHPNLNLAQSAPCSRLPAICAAIPPLHTNNVQALDQPTFGLRRHQNIQPSQHPKQYAFVQIPEAFPLPLPHTPNTTHLPFLTAEPSSYGPPFSTPRQLRPARSISASSQRHRNHSPALRPQLPLALLHFACVFLGPSSAHTIAVTLTSAPTHALRAVQLDCRVAHLSPVHILPAPRDNLSLSLFPHH
ncbi:uncharacterized protein CCOS01_17045 [Colletotrichum costaricense]|uniref:Uncharacterized protein n=1 Tax=Colletotrichum costaricense TaxID=1209916 RepID=A0AAJ0DRU9_9PEZI|nr:uncharacterized protein CCOS01_17045 [Colletotrichum costaricense]KAK1503187.1 hypothetical protein CCOS01_17045 [Colletotrichum costaricense]